MELTEPARERFFGDLARRVGADMPSGEAFRHWRERIVSDSTVRLGGQQRPSPEGPPPSFVSFRDTWLERFRALFQQWRVAVPVESGANAYSDFHASAIAYRDVPLALVTLGLASDLVNLSDSQRALGDAQQQLDVDPEILVGIDLQGKML